MEKGRLNINLSIYIIVAFVLSILGQFILSCIFLAFVIFYEKNEQLTRQVLQPFLMIICYEILTIVISIFSVFQLVIGLDFIIGMLSIGSIFIVSLVFFVLNIIGLIQVLSKKYVKIPVFYNLANALYDKVIVNIQNNNSGNNMY